MKKYLLIIPLISLLWSCKKQNETNPISQSQAPTVAKVKKAAGARDGYLDLLGYGYDATGEYATSASATFQVLNVAQLKADYPTRVEDDLSATSSVNIYSGYSIEQYLQKLTNKINSSASVTMFKGSVNATFQDTLSTFSQYVYSDYNVLCD